MPVHRFLKTHTGVLESYIGFNDQQQLTETFQPCTNEALKTHVETVLPSIEGPYLSEANLWIDDWLRNCFAMMNQGLLLIIDYGFPRHEYYHPDRHQGTLMCHYQHKAHTNPLLNPGQQDITAHVDFTHVADAAHHAGFHVAGYSNQASFLLSNGLLNLVDNEQALCQRQAVKTLLQPDEMGELFKVMALTKQWDTPLSGFQLHDKRAYL